MAPDSRNTAVAGVLHGATADDVARFADDPSLSAVFVPDGRPEAWLRGLAELVVGGRLVIPRTTLASVTRDEFTDWAHTALAHAPAAVAGPLVDDMAAVLTRVVDTTRTGRVMVRLFTEAPTRRCGFHVDTVPPQSTTIGAVRVYNGPTTEYVDGKDVLGMGEFYAHLARRERLSRRARSTAGAGEAGGPGEGALDELCSMDEKPSFLRPGAVVRRVPSDATVFFRHLDVRRHWSPHPVADVWIHRSPMHGPARLVLNVSPAPRVAASPGRG
ncbi:DUF1826 domain-containing protein [Streptomyces sp. NBC_01278]|uniref:DUF1826 domain-containing protein n=1 Tax=Streptomyces sp. NBC_01278 TaxID=2903809 RepID=UPI002E33E7FF|nr:DUF1826 domain-containing protein [Streptomyces sp. NBC_01278]